jgi:hypothetical protein
MKESLTRAMTVFKQHFEPAYALKESDEQLSTEEIFEKFNKLTFDPELTIDVIHDLMEENGFRYDYVMDSFKWLLKYVK